MAEFTKADAVRKANAIKKDNPDFAPAKIKAIIEKQNGPLVFDGEEFYFKSTGKGSLAIESVDVKNTRKQRANSTRNREMRRKTPLQREFIAEAKQFFDENNITRLDGKTARQYGISQYQQAKEALKNEKLRIKEAGLTAGHIDPAVGGETLERTGNYFGEPGQQNFTNRNRKPGPRTAKALQVQLPREEAIQRTMGFGQDLPQFTDEQIDATLKGKGQRLGGVSQTTRLPPVADTVKPSLLSQFSPEQRRQLEAAPDLESKENLVKQFKSNKGLTAARLARNVAPLALSVPLGIGVAGQSAAAAVKNPTQDNVVNAGFDVANSLADLVGLIPTPMTVAASEGIQRALMLGQMTYNTQRTLERLAGMKNK